MNEVTNFGAEKSQKVSFPLKKRIGGLRTRSCGNFAEEELLLDVETDRQVLVLIVFTGLSGQ